MKKIIFAFSLSALLFSCGSESMEDKATSELNAAKEEMTSKVEKAKEDIKSEVKDVKEDLSKLVDEVPTAEETQKEIEELDNGVDDLLNDI